ncbi:MAG: acetyl-CoA carboxylase biotin carboxylase subunit [Gemmatimonadales bacterium]
MRRVLIANRGEIALRVIRACRDEGLESVAVFSDADRDAPFVRAADRAIRIGPPAPSESYLRIDAIIAAARESGADAVHPGYGFLSERAPFAVAVDAAGLTFIGPPASAIAAMGDKTAARSRMAAAGVPIVPGATEAVRSEADAATTAESIGYPVLVKAAAGGGGKGMRVVLDAGELPASLCAASREAEKAFGDGAVYLEKYIERPRHIEIQVLADHERTVHLGERECSIQRRHQKLIEEAPSVAVDAPLRERMGAAAVAAASAVGYRGAGTCEFLLAPDGAFYFLEMNARIQVEHTVTEEVYGIDLVREQLRIAAGKAMSLPRGQPVPRQWAIECRITSEDPANGLLPSAGTIRWLRPPAGPGVRWECGVETGSEVTLFYDSMIAKLIARGTTRADAIATMRRALRELMIVGVATNVPLHLAVLDDPEFVAGAIDIQFLDRRHDLVAPPMDDADATRLAVAAALLAERQRTSRTAMGTVVSKGIVAARSAWTEAGRIDALR